MITLILVDDDPMIRRGLRMRLAIEKDIQIVGEAADGKQAIELARSLKPDVVVMDVVMPNVDGITATQEIHRTCASINIVILSLHGDEAARVRAFAAGAVAFLTKGENEQELVPTIRKITQSPPMLD